jgi:catechol 2,3-dioxygenase-like lactoylglutathione lyase family enzyme
MEVMYMTHPITPYMPVVFIPVSNLKRSIEWYCELLEIPMQPKQDGGGIYYFNLEGTDLILDSNMWGFPPMIMFDTPDIDAAYSFCQNQQYPYMNELQRFPDVSFFSTASTMVCQAKRSPASPHPQAAHPLLQKICRVIVHADHNADLEEWYETFLQKSAEPDQWVDGLSCIRMARGAHLLIDDNRLSQTDKVRFDRLQLDLRVNPIAIIESPDLEAAMAYVRSKGAMVKGGIERRHGMAFFIFYDPDGNGLMVCESKQWMIECLL